MKTSMLALAAVAAAGLSTLAHAGAITYTWDASASTATLGDTVLLTLHASIDPGSDPFNGLAVAEFDVVVGDAPGLGVLANSGPGLGLAPSFIAAGNQGMLMGNLIMGVQAGQFPQFMNPTINLGTELDLYTISYTVTDDTPRDVTFIASIFDSTVYTSAMGASMGFDGFATPFTLSVVQVPAPGAVALLGLAGLVGLRRRRTTA